MAQGIHYQPRSYTNDVIVATVTDLYTDVTIATMISYWYQSDIIEMPFCKKWLFPSCYGNRSMLSFHLWSKGSMAYNAFLEL